MPGVRLLTWMVKMKQHTGKRISLIFGLILSLNVLPLDGSDCEAAQKSRPRKPRARAPRIPAEPTPDVTDSRREAAHKLMLNGENQHDGAGELLEIGDISSAPALLRVLKDNPPTRKADGRLTYICTAAHALSALRRISGINGGATYE